MSRTLSMILFSAAFFAILGVAHGYIWLRLVRDARLVRRYHRISTWVIVALGVSVPLAFFVGRELPFSISRVLGFGPFLWLGVMMLLVFWFLLADEIRLLVFLVRKISRAGRAPPDPSRRQALGRILAGGAGLVVGGMTTASVALAARRPEIVRREFALSRFPSALDGFRLVQISDIHVGITIGRAWMEDMVRRVNELRPDLIAITGDLVDGSVEKLAAEVAPITELKAEHGVFFVTGNHEYYFGAEPWIAHLQSVGVRVLRNEHVEIGRGADAFLLAGVDDHEAARLAPGHGTDLERALDGADPTREVVLMAHQPMTAKQAVDRGGIGLVLSGHTHGGQIWPLTILVGVVQPYLKGTYREGETIVHVNEGTGVWGPPMRLGTRSEITEIILRAR
jgi:uncharacterized protein